MRKSLGVRSSSPTNTSIVSVEIHRAGERPATSWVVAVVAFWSHKPKVGGSSPSPTTISWCMNGMVSHM